MAVDFWHRVALILLVLSTLIFCPSLASDATQELVHSLKSHGFRGSIHPHHSYGYEKYRKVQNGACNRVLFPLVIIRPASTYDVAVGIKVARSHYIDISVRSGGHGYTCNNIKNGSLHFDMRRLNKVELVKDGYVSQQLDSGTIICASSDLLLNVVVSF